MKGRIECPNCSGIFDIDHINDKDDTPLSCPNCQHQFIIHPSCDKASEKRQGKEDCDWEEHGEPRKTILSSMKPRTDRPMIATFLLMIVICIGIIASITPGIFLQTPVMIFAATGSQGSLSLQLPEINISTINQVSLRIHEENEVYNGIIQNDSIVFKNLPLGSFNSEITFNTINKTTLLPLDLFVIPVLSNSYTISLVNQDELTVTHDGFGWCSAILLILSVVCLVGMFSAWRRNHSYIALIGSFVGIFTIGFFFIGSILSIIAFYLIYQSRDEFDDGKKGKSF